MDDVTATVSGVSIYLGAGQRLKNRYREKESPFHGQSPILRGKIQSAGVEKQPGVEI